MKNSEGVYADLEYGVVPSNYASGNYEHPSLNQQQRSEDLYMEFTQNGAQSSYSELNTTATGPGDTYQVLSDS